MVVLAARRAGNTGIPVIVATSSSDGDDALARLLHQFGIECFRGSLDDTLDRVVQACSSYTDDTVIVRLTADNVFPDGALLGELIEEFHSSRLEYLSCNGVPSGVPYGMSAEVTRLKHLRDANAADITPSDREHVTPAVIRKYGIRYFEKYQSMRKGHFRCTVDTYDDYRSMQRLFLAHDDPVGVSTLALVEQLSELPYQPRSPEAVPRLVVGGAQLGLNYGVVNTRGKPAQALATEMLKTAIGNGIRWIDTANAYGESEEVIGTALEHGWANRVEVVTKLSPDIGGTQTSESEVQARVDASVFESCKRLRARKLAVVLMHRAAHLTQWNGAAWRRLLELQQAGHIDKLGVSVQGPEELARALDEEQVGFIQMPFSLLDGRWRESLPRLRAARRERGLVVHVRSTLLQGLLASRDRNAWARANVAEPEVLWAWLDELIATCGRQDAADLAFAYALAQEWIDGVVVGMESLDQLTMNIGYFTAPKLDEEQVLHIENTRPEAGEDILNPARWR